MLLRNKAQFQNYHKLLLWILINYFNLFLQLTVEYNNPIKKSFIQTQIIGKKS